MYESEAVGGECPLRAKQRHSVYKMEWRAILTGLDRAEVLAAIAGRLARARGVFALTGAGLGVASGLGTFRGPDGYWRKRSFEQLASLHGFHADPALVWTWYNERIAAYLAATPNAGHRALVELQELVSHLVVATQNVDGLQARAGTRNVLELHGSIFDVKCTGGCVPRGTPFERLSGPLDLVRLRHEGCDGLRRPGVVWFGEHLPQDALREAQRESRQADVILVAGTSAQVEPAASLAQKYRSETMIVEINPEPVLRHRTPFVLAEGTETGLPAIVEALREMQQR
jgi:NAD-dependent deacetylase